MAVFDTMRHIRPDVSTVCVGLAASMGAFLLASGHVGKRYSLTNRCAGGGGGGGVTAEACRGRGSDGAPTPLPPANARNVPLKPPPPLLAPPAAL